MAVCVKIRYRRWLPHWIPPPAAAKMLVLMLLLHGTRISETAAARWDDIDWAEREWLIPADNTKPRLLTVCR